MMRALFAGLWAVILVTGSVYYFSVMAGAGNDEESKDQANIELYNLDTTSIPVIRNNEVRGYLLVSAVFTVASDVSAQLPFPVEYQIRDSVFEALFSDRDLDIFQLDKLDMGKMRDNIKERINRKYPRLVDDIKFQYFDFMTKNEVRDMQLRRY